MCRNWKYIKHRSRSQLIYIFASEREMWWGGKKKKREERDATCFRDGDETTNTPTIMQCCKSCLMSSKLLLRNRLNRKLYPSLNWPSPTLRRELSCVIASRESEIKSTLKFFRYGGEGESWARDKSLSFLSLETLAPTNYIKIITLLLISPS
jgi:hypothetical protein